MSAEMDSSTDTIELYVCLLNEGTDVLRPTQGVRLENDEVRILPTNDYDPSIEEWEFPPGSTVKCRSEVRDGRRLLVARQRVA